MYKRIREGNCCLKEKEGRRKIYKDGKIFGLRS